VVCDDSSTDATLQILENFQEMAPFPVRIYRNEINLGPTKNFEKAVTLCNGDIIALSDQDDVWIPHKLEKLEKVFKEYPETGYVFSNALVVDANLHPLGYTMWDQLSFTARQRKRFERDVRYQVEVLLKHNVVTGATMAFHAELRDWILPIPGQWIHDAWIALLASAAGARGIFIKEALVKYRQHCNQVIGGRKISLGEQVQRALLTRGEAYSYEKIRFLQVLDRLISARKGNRNTLELIEAKVQHLRARQELYEGSTLKRIKNVLQEVLAGRYHKFSNGWKSVAKDLLVAINSKTFRRAI